MFEGETGRTTQRSAELWMKHVTSALWVAWADDFSSMHCTRCVFLLRGVFSRGRRLNKKIRGHGAFKRLAASPS